MKISLKTFKQCMNNHSIYETELALQMRKVRILRALSNFYIINKWSQKMTNFVKFRIRLALAMQLFLFLIYILFFALLVGF